MSRWLALAQVQEEETTPCDSVTKHDKTQPERENRGFVTFCQLSQGVTSPVSAVDMDAFEERAAIIEFDGGLGRHEAEDLAAQAQGYDNVIAMKSALSMREGSHE